MLRLMRRQGWQQGLAGIELADDDQQEQLVQLLDGVAQENPFIHLRRKMAQLLD